MSLDPSDIKEGDILWYIRNPSDPTNRVQTKVLKVHFEAPYEHWFEIELTNEDGENFAKPTEIERLRGHQFDTQDEESVFAALEDADIDMNLEKGVTNEPTEEYLIGEPSDTPVAVAQSVLQPDYDEENAATATTISSEDDTATFSLQQIPTDQSPIPPPKGQEKTPKAALYTWCFQKYRISLSNRDYITWDNGDMDHLKQYTSILVHPQTGECFSSGRFEISNEGETSSKKHSYLVQVVDPDIEPLVWYPTKKLAEHGAAARAYDCLTLREGIQEGVVYIQLGLDKPSQDRMTLPSVPDSVYEQIEKLSPTTT